jgi:hypothetical protein
MSAHPIIDEYNKMKHPASKIISADDPRYSNVFEDYSSLLSLPVKYVIFCDYDDYGDGRPDPIHYDTNFGGSKEFNELLDRYGLAFDWEDCGSVMLYPKSEYQCARDDADVRARGPCRHVCHGNCGSHCDAPDCVSKGTKSPPDHVVSDSDEDDFDYEDSCDCCVKGWDKANEFGRCDCIHKCGKLLRECKYQCDDDACNGKGTLEEYGVL